MGHEQARVLETMRLLGREHVERFPISIAGAGVARWIGDHRFGRTGTMNFAIEQITYGNAVFIQNGREYLVNPGEVYCLQAGSDNSYRTGPAGVLHKRFVGFYGTALTTVFRTLGLIGCDLIRPRDPRAVTRLLRESYVLLDKKGPREVRRLAAVAYELLLVLSADLPPAYPSPLGAVLTFIELNLGRRISMAEISDQAGIDSVSLLKAFKTHIGMTPLQYVIGQRLAWAQRLLIDTDKPIKEIAATVGYDDQLHFSAQFRKHVGVAPRKYRSAPNREA